MGCGSGQKETSAPIRVVTPTGRLKITITNAILYHKVSSFKMDPYIILRLSNQTYTSKVIQDGDKEPSFFETFTFVINSYYKVHGRNLQVTVMDQKKLRPDSEIGFGIVDLDPVINFKKPKDEFRCFISYDREKAGLVNIIAEFAEETAQTLSFRFDSASIRRKTSTFGSANCWVQATIGEEVLHTQKHKDTKQSPPIWSKQILTFNVPASAKEVLIQIMDDNEQIGKLTMELEKLLSTNSEQSFNEQFLFNNEVNAGSLKFVTLTGVNPVFSELKTSIVKNSNESKVAQPKKEEPKKQELPKVQNNSASPANPATNQVKAA